MNSVIAALTTANTKKVVLHDQRRVTKAVLYAVGRLIDSAD